jgi:hypothetical protein
VLTGRLTRLVAILLGATALLFVIATTAERSSGTHKEPAASGSSETATSVETTPAETTATETAGESTDAGEATHNEAAKKSGRPEAAATATHREPSELKVLGVDAEGRGFVILGALLSVALAAAAWMRPAPPLLMAVGVFGAGFAVMDAVEARHQMSEGRGSLATAAWLLFAGHVAIAAVAAVAARSGTIARAASSSDAGAEAS